MQGFCPQKKQGPPLNLQPFSNITNLNPMKPLTLAIFGTLLACHPALAQSETMDYCGNADFHQGNFFGWLGGKGTHLYNAIQWTDPQHLAAPEHQLLVSSWPAPGDPLVGLRIPLNAPGGSHFVRLGNPDQVPEGGQVQRLSYTIEVTETNALLKFQAAAVLEGSSSHAPFTQAFFSWRLYFGADEWIAGDRYTAFSDMRLRHLAGTSVYYLPWTCWEIDVSQYIGKKLVFECVTGGCGDTGHRGYAYFSGLCRQNAAPAGQIQLPQTISLDESGLEAVEASGAGSANFYRWFWSVHPVNAAGAAGAGIATPITSGQSTPLFHNCIGYWAYQSGKQVHCGDVFEVRLHLIGHCGATAVVSTRTQVICL